jgi:4-amino-4-deoxy-L-arabinose transferase-like glycosyltransferase
MTVQEAPSVAPVRTRRVPARVLAGLAVLTVVACLLRFSGIATRTITHPEMYNPGIRMPEGLSEPRQRLTLTQVITGTLSSDGHPPAYFVFMFFWTKLFGVSLTALRIPSVIISSLCVPLTWWLGALTVNRRAGWIAALFMTFNGYHIFMSRNARNYGPACTIAVLATVLLVLAARSYTHKRLLLWLYFTALVLGLATHHFLWLLWAAHTIWCFLRAWSEGRGFSGLCRIQVLAFVAASPLIALASYQSDLPTTLGSNFPLWFLDFIRFGFLFPNDSSGFVAAQPVVLRGFSGLALYIAAATIAFVLLLASFRARPRRLGETFADAGPAAWTWIAAAITASAAIFAFVVLAKLFAKPQPFPTLATTRALIPLPLCAAALAVVLERILRRRAPRWLAATRTVAARDGIVILSAFVPFAILGMLAPFKPIFNQRGVLFATPFILIVLAAGFLELIRRTRAAVPAGVVIVVLHAVSVAIHEPMLADPVDYQQFVTSVKQYTQPNDLIFLVKRWNVTPVLYYLPADRYHLVGANYDEACRLHPHSRVWALALYDADIHPHIKHALAEYRMLKTIEGPYVKAVLYEWPQ